MSEWTSVKDILPTGRCDYLFYSLDFNAYCCGCVYKGVIQSYDKDLCHKDISHWMSLPEPPEVK